MWKIIFLNFFFHEYFLKSNIVVISLMTTMTQSLYCMFSKYVQNEYLRGNLVQNIYLKQFQGFKDLILHEIKKKLFKYISNLSIVFNNSLPFEAIFSKK